MKLCGGRCPFSGNFKLTGKLGFTVQGPFKTQFGLIINLLLNRR